MLFLACGNRCLLLGPEGQSVCGAERGLNIREKNALKTQTKTEELGVRGGGRVGKGWTGFAWKHSWVK